MEFRYRLTILECILCGIRRALGRPFHIPFEIMELYQRCGKKPRTVKIEDGSIFVIEETVTREFLCRDIQEFRQKGKVFHTIMTGRVGTTVQLYLPVRIVGDEQAQDRFRDYLNEQRRVSGDKLVMGTLRNSSSHVLSEPTQAERYFHQKWNLDTMSRAVAESLWMDDHCMVERKWRDWGLKKRPLFLAFGLLFPVVWVFLNTQTISIYLALIAILILKTRQEWGSTVSMKSIRRQVEAWGSEIYTEVWELFVSSEQVKRKIPQMENAWNWEAFGFLLETEDFYFFYTKQQSPMFYVEKSLFGDWMAQKLFVQECQGRGLRYKFVHPMIVMDRELNDGEQSDKIRPITKPPEKRQKPRKRGSDTQDGWRKFWAKKEKERSSSGRTQTMFVVLGMTALLLLAFFLPEYGGRQSIAGVPVVMDMPEDGEPYVFRPEAYQDYVPLAEQVVALESLGFQIPEEVVTELNAGMNDIPTSRVWVEGYPYCSLLMRLGMPEWDYETYEIKSFPEQAYWFDWEGFDMGSEYVSILNGVNAMARAEFTISGAKQDMSEADWEKGRGTVQIAFCVNEIPYEYEMKLEHDWLDPKIVGDINDALQKTGIEKRVYAMADGGQGCILMYGDEEWAKRFMEVTGIKLEAK